MAYKWMGAALVVLACGGFGFYLSASHRREESCLRQLIGLLDYMECELQYRLTPLPELCVQVGRQAEGILQAMFYRLGEEMSAMCASEVTGCMGKVLTEFPGLPPSVRSAFVQLGKSLGRFDLDGQVRGLEAVRRECRRMLDGLCAHREERLRSYKTLGLCAGAVIVILFI